VICKIDYPSNLRDCSFHNRLNTLFESEVRGAAPLASAMESQINVVVSDIYYLHRSPVLGHAGIDLRINEVLDFLPGIPSDEHHLFVNLVRS